MISRKTILRLIAWLVIIGVHVAVLLVLLTHREPVAARQTVAALTVRAVPEPLGMPSPPGATPAIPTTVDPPTFDIAVAPTGPAAACDLTAAVAAALGADPSATVALVQVVADPQRAVMLWDGGWVDRAPDDPVRRAVAGALGAAHGECLDERQVGPRIVIVARDGGPIVVAVGSGAWRWRDLLSFDKSSVESHDPVPVVRK